MKYFFLLLFLISGVCYGQTTYYIQADSVRFRKIGANSDFILENSTRARTGAYLKNRWNGRTEFGYAVDSGSVSGSDLILWRGNGTQNITIPGIGTTYTFTNGLTESPAGTSKLGGLLTGTTIIEGGTNSFLHYNLGATTFQTTSTTAMHLSATNGTDSSYLDIRRAGPPSQKIVKMVSNIGGNLATVQVGGANGLVTINSNSPSIWNGLITIQNDMILRIQDLAGLRESEINMQTDSITIKPSLGVLNIDSLRSWSGITDTTFKKVMTWDTRNGRWEYSNWFGGGAGGGGDVTKVGTPVNNQIGVWTGDGTIEGDADLTFDGADLTTTGDIKPTSLYLPTTTAFDAGKPGRIYNGSLTSLSIIGTAQAVQELGLYSANGTNGLSIKTSAAIVVIAPNGKLAVGGDFTPTAIIHPIAGTASANTAPLKFTSGVSGQTSKELGAVNYDGTDLTLSDATYAYTLNKSLNGSAALDFGSTGAGAVADLTITVTGAADGDVVTLGVPNGSVTATATYTAWVSAANTVTVRFSPKATEDPASGTFKVRVIK